MTDVTLVVPVDPSHPLAPERLERCCAQLDTRGYSYEIVVAGLPEAQPESLTISRPWRWVESELSGLAPAAMAGLDSAIGDAVVILDEGMGYDLADVGAIVAPLLAGEAELVIGSRLTRARGGLRKLLGIIARALVGTTDPISGLVAVRKSAYHEAAERLSAVGSKFSFELIAKVNGRLLDVPVRRPHVGRRDWPTLDDLRHWKRLADHRFGNFSRLVQFCAVGASGMVVDLASYAFFQLIFARTPLLYLTTRVWQFSWPSHLAASAVVAVSLALIWNFSLNRRLTFNDARSGSILRQFFAYVLSNAVSVPLSLFLRLQLPVWHPFFDRHRLAAAFVGIVAATAVSFSMARWLVFRRPRDTQPPSAPQIAPIAAEAVGRDA